MILLTGATGKTGGEVARQLAARGVKFRALLRNPDKAPPLEALGAEVVIGDVGDRAGLDRALAGVDKAFLVLPNNEEQLALEKSFTDACKAAGVQHLLYLSSMESVPGSTSPITQNHVAAEDYIRASGVPFTMIRPTFFMQIFLGSAPRIKATGRIVMPAGNGTVAATDLRDVGEVIAKVLTEPGHANQSYDLTGPELLTFHQIAAVFSTVLGREIEYVDQPLEEFKQVLRGAKFAEWRVDAVSKEFEAIAGGMIDHTTTKMQELLGRPSTSLQQFIRDHIDAFR
jgi:uncharacterized protein YbjT (DUF2867 family)